MGDTYASAKNIQVNITFKIESEQTKTPVSFSNDFEYAIQKPVNYNRKLKDSTSGDLIRQIVGNEKNTTIYFNDIKGYLVEDNPLDFSQALEVDSDSAIAMLDSITFIGYLIQDDPAKKINNDLKALAYNGKVESNNDTLHHLAGVFNKNDTEFWIDAGDTPLLRKATIDMTGQLRLPGLPPDTPLTATITYNDWKLNQTIPAERFVFSPPDGAKQIASTRELQIEMQKYQSRQESLNHPLVGKPAPDFTLDLLDGGKMTLSQHKGKDIVVLDFWATWCPPCIKSMPIMVETTGEFKDRNVVFYAVNKNQEKAVVERFMKRQKYKTTVALDTDNSVSSKYGVQSIPFSVIIGKDGLVKLVHKGALPDPKAMKQLIIDDLNYVLNE
jgi:peroxiredoxin/outer membrane lipoprotein-sorting protein